MLRSGWVPPQAFFLVSALFHYLGPSPASAWWQPA